MFHNGLQITPMDPPSVAIKEFTQEPFVLHCVALKAKFRGGARGTMTAQKVIVGH
jgi:hypothetical protein